jgi:chain length determinant protein tyrosine kinase EpsG
MVSEVREHPSVATLSEQERAVRDRSIGRILLDSRKITLRDADKIINFQKREALLFGEAALKLGLITPEDLRRALAEQFAYTYVAPGEAKFSKELVTAYQPTGEEAERFRAVRSHLLLRWFSAERRGLVVVSPSKGDGRSYVAANLAVALSQAGERTLLIDADLRNPRQHAVFNVPNDRGLSLVLGELSAEPGEVMLPFFQNLALMPAGPRPPNPQELLSRQAFRTLLATMQRRYDVILVDSPAAAENSDAEIVAARVGGAMVVARKNRTRVAELTKLEQKLLDAQAQVVGSVFNCY